MTVSNLRESFYCLEAPPTSLPTAPPIIIDSGQDRARIALTYINKGLPVGQEVWKKEATQRLMSLATNAYWILAVIANEMNKLGRSLRYLRLCLLCYSMLLIFINKSY